MALKRRFSQKFKGINFASGSFYKFKYQNYENDPKPIIVFLNSITGVHPGTNHKWNLIQAINLNYIPRRDRKKFVDLWIQQYNKSNGNIKLTWKRVTSRYPYIRYGIRRYLMSPSSYIINPRGISFDQIQDQVVKSWSKDFSHKIKRNIASRFKKLKKRL